MLKFFNIKSGETRVAETEPMISAFWSSSDRGPNSNKGQDFGWRLSAETVVEMERIQNDPDQVRNIAIQYGIIPESVSESDILKHISDKNDNAQTGMSKNTEDFEAIYEADIRKHREVKTINNDENTVKSNKNTNKEGSSNGKKESK